MYNDLSPSEVLQKELTKWVRKMSKPNEDSIEALEPRLRMIPKDKKKRLQA
jgi:hypothetical protein